jgi:hypothetical protein
MINTIIPITYIIYKGLVGGKLFVHLQKKVETILRNLGGKYKIYICIVPSTLGKAFCFYLEAISMV